MECDRHGVEKGRHGCRECRREQAAWLTPEWKAKKAKRRRALRVEVIEHYGGKCACCGESEIAFLTMDHIGGNGTQHRESVGGDIYPWLKREGYPSGFEPLCWNCNAAKHFEPGGCPHRRKV